MKILLIKHLSPLYDRGSGQHTNRNSGTLTDQYTLSQAGGSHQDLVVFTEPLRISLNLGSNLTTSD